MELLLIVLVAGLLIWALHSAASARQTSGDAAGETRDGDGEGGD